MIETTVSDSFESDEAVLISAKSIDRSDKILYEECPQRSTTTIPATLSELTRITIKESHEQLDHSPICLQFIEESDSQLLQVDAANFPPPRDPGINAYMSVIENDDYFGWERYCRECHKYSIPRISAVKDILDGKTTVFNLRVENILYIEKKK